MRKVVFLLCCTAGLSGCLTSSVLVTVRPDGRDGRNNDSPNPAMATLVTLCRRARSKPGSGEHIARIAEIRSAARASVATAGPLVETSAQANPRLGVTYDFDMDEGSRLPDRCRRCPVCRAFTASQQKKPVHRRDLRSPSNRSPVVWSV